MPPIRVVSYSIYHSSNSYLGVILAGRALAGLPVELERRPLCIPRARGQLVAHLVGSQEGPGRGSYHREDCLRWARKHGIEINFPRPEVFMQRMQKWQAGELDREELAARAYYGAFGSGREAALDAAFFRLSYVDGLDVNDEEVVRRGVREAGLDVDEAMARAMSPATRAKLDESLAEFDAARCPGLPTWIVAGERYWGKDRVDWLAERVRELSA